MERAAEAWAIYRLRTEWAETLDMRFISTTGITILIVAKTQERV